MKRDIPFVLGMVQGDIAPGSIEGPPSELLLTYRRTGGIAYERPDGITSYDDHMVVYENGATTIRRGAVTIQTSLEPETIALLRNLLKAADLPHQREYNPPPQRISNYEDAGFDADYSTFEVTHGGYVVRMADTGIPMELSPLLEALIDIVADHSAPSQDSEAEGTSCG